MLKDVVLFLKYNEKVKRSIMPTDFYTEQNLESLVYNCESLIKNHKKEGDNRINGGDCGC